MKRLILSLIVVAFAAAAQAGDAKTSQAKDQAQPSCCSGKMQTSLQTKDPAPTTEKSCCGCCAQSKQQKAVKQTALLSPKAASLLR